MCKCGDRILTRRKQIPIKNALSFMQYEDSKSFTLLYTYIDNAGSKRIYANILQLWNFYFISIIIASN